MWIVGGLIARRTCELRVSDTRNIRDVSFLQLGILTTGIRAKIAFS